MGDVVDIAQKAALKYLRSILGLKNNVSSRRSRLVFGLPKLEHQLIVRLVKNISKYIKHFQEFPDIYGKTIEEYGKWLNISVDLVSVEPRTLKELVMQRSIKETAEKENILIGNRFRDVLSKYLYKSR